MLMIFPWLAGCANELIFRDCRTIREEPPIQPDESSSLGFSADEVLDAMVLAFDVRVVSLQGSPATQRSFSFAFVADGAAQVAEQRLQSGEDTNAYCIEGASLLVPTILTVTSVDDWFTGSGPATVIAQGTTEDRIWVDAQFPVDPSEELLAYAAAHNLPGCTEADITLVYSQGRKVWAPWSTGPNGGFDNQACDGASGAVYEWGLVEPPE